jgi:hypothetical protein
MTNSSAGTKVSFRYIADIGRVARHANPSSSKIDAPISGDNALTIQIGPSQVLLLFRCLDENTFASGVSSREFDKYFAHSLTNMVY